MNIGFDLDDTIIDHSHNAVLLAKELGYDTPHPLRTENVKEALKSLLSGKDYRNFKEKLYGEISLSANPIEQSLETLRFLKGSGAVPYVISRRLKSRDLASMWLARNAPFIDRENIFFVFNDHEKYDICKARDIRLMLDDTLEVLEHMRPPVIPILFDRFGEYADTRFKRVNDWNEFRELYAKLGSNH